jgi:hypothetical protein
MTLEEEILKLDLIASDAFEGGDANEFRQLAEWLRELRELRRNRIGRVSVGCATCIHMKTDDYTKRPCDMCCNNYFSKYEAEVNADE